MGSTTVKEMITERFFEPIQMRARITKEATGTDFVREITGDRKSLIREKRQAAVPSIIPDKKARRNPRLILAKEQMTVFQKSGEGSRWMRQPVPERGQQTESDCQRQQLQAAIWPARTE